ncbi:MULTISPECIES: DUF6297 family protein [Nocardiopsis]|uniref:Uncharacterized protein n=3 Tax=Nocardiopsis dassonvillei TaxID=2014 RepID=D7B7B7_NOCDD|nr:DUF6297 family protein [Nocardiopsis dassonvillei]ADH67489.1 conserved hypothetical protein [Nocardiopsis dassonvillei subsp. dassonvillei DSM 43111]APC35693.1 hypothetical protein A9R04_13785 [Nocardiopsis dassonvillei]VEI87732.1 Uncharacterised protein [Nocardiopsis dassonvillei]
MNGTTRTRGAWTGATRVRAFVRARNRRHRSWSDRYVILLALGLLVVTVSPVIGRAVAAVPDAVDPARAGAGLALVALLLAASLRLARAVGPVAVSAADAAWLVLSPLPRRGVLAPALLVMAVVCAVVGAVFGLALLSALGAPDALALRLLASVVLAVSWTMGGTATAVLAQASQPWDERLTALLVALVVAAAAATVMGAGPGRGVLVGIASAPVSAWGAAACASAGVAAALAWRAWRALARIPARAVLEASSRAELAAGALMVMDPGSLSWIAEDAHWRSRVLRSRAWPSRLRGAAAVAWLDWRRLARRPGILALVAAATVLPVLAARAGAGETGALVVLAVGALAVAATGTAGARRDAGDAALARLLGTGPRALLAARAVLPALLGGLWLTLALVGLDLAGSGGLLWPLGLLCAPALAAGALRLARRRPVEHTMPVVDTPLGPVPLGPVVWALTGADIAVLGCLPALLAFATGVTGPLLAAQAVWGAVVLAAYCAAPRRG